MSEVKDVAIVGIGTAGFFRSTDESVELLTHRAVIDALKDCALSRADIDALFVHIGSPRGSDYDAIARLLALDVAIAGQTWAHGRFMSTGIQHAAMAVQTGNCEVALCIGAFRNSPF